MIAPLRESFNETLRRSATTWRKSSMILKHDELLAEFDRRQWNHLAILLTCLSCAAADMNYSMLVSFFPEAAREKGLSPMMTGTLFSVFQLFNLVTCFIVPCVTSKVGGIRVMAIANLSQAALTTALACTNLIQNHSSFFWTFLSLRCAQGIVAAFSETAAGGIVSRSVPVDRIGEAVAWVEASRILGILCGPIFGGKLFSAFGFSVPFIFTASILSVLGLLTIFLPIDMTAENKEDDETSTENITWKLIRRPVVSIIFLSLLITSAAITFVEPTLQLYMAKAPYNLSHAQVGALYITSTLVFAVVATFSSSFTKLMGDTLSLSMGIGLMGLAYILLAPPAPTNTGTLAIFSFLHESSQFGAIALTATGMATIGIGGGLILGPANNLLVEEGNYIGLGDGASVSIARTLNIAFTSGGAVGPFVSGLLTHHIGFSPSCALFAFFLLGAFIVILSTIGLIRICRKQPSRESQIDRMFSSPLLEDDLNIL